MTGIKAARIRTCHTCAARYTRHATVLPWPMCQDALALLDNVRLEGPDTNCPRGLWKDLTPVDLAAEAAAAEATAHEQCVARGKRLVDALTPDDRDRATLRIRLGELVAAGELTPAAAVEVEDYAVARTVARA